MMKWFLFNLLCTLAALGSSLYVYFAEHDRLLERIPIHWKASMEADRWADRDEILGYFLIIPGVMGLMTILTLLLHWASATKPNINRFGNVFGIFLSAMVVLLGCLLLMQLRAAMQ